MGIRIGGGQGFYGDSPRGARVLLKEGVDYLCLEALSELTLAILQKDRQRDENLGYTRDLPLYLRYALPEVAAGRTKVITNAGGIHPEAAGLAARMAAGMMQLEGVKVAVVTGADLRPRLDALRAGGAALAHMDTGAPWDALPASPRFADAYLGARPIVEALERGANVVVTGRVSDASLFLAPLIFEHGWGWDDWDRLAAGVLVGHLLECSGQVVGGNFSGPGWASLPRPWDHPYPIADVEADGTAVITKPAASGGAVTFDTVRHQLLYEVGDPARYLNPDVVADFTSARFDDLGGDRVRVSEVRGAPAPDDYKALVAYHHGWSSEVRLAFGFPDALEKAKVTAALVRKRAAMARLDVAEWHAEYWGVNALGGPTVPPPAADAPEPAEVALRLAWRCDDEDVAKRVAREAIGLALGAPPAGLTPMGRGRVGETTELLGLWPTLVPRGLVDEGVAVDVQEVT